MHRDGPLGSCAEGWGGPGILRSDCEHVKPESVLTPRWCRGEPLGLESDLGGTLPLPFEPPLSTL